MSERGKRDDRKEITADREERDDKLSRVDLLGVLREEPVAGGAVPP